MQAITIAIVEDEPATRAALEQRVLGVGRFRLAWTAGTLADARAKLQAPPPDVMVVDIGLPDGSGLDLIEESRRRFRSLSILVLTVFGDERKLIAAIECGARGYLLKDEPVIGLVEAIDQVHAGGAPISPAIARHLVTRLVGGRGASPPADCSLTAREIEVLQLAAKGYNHGEIASLLGIRANTVGSYTRRIYEKLEVHSRSEAIYEASRLGLLGGRHE